MPLVAGQTTTVEVRLYARDGNRITEVSGGVELSFTFNPVALASSTPVQGQPLVRNVTSTAAGAGGTLTVSLRLIADALSKAFGPFDVLVH